MSEGEESFLHNRRCGICGGRMEPVGYTGRIGDAFTYHCTRCDVEVPATVGRAFIAEDTKAQAFRELEATIDGLRAKGYRYVFLAAAKENPDAQQSGAPVVCMVSKCEDFDAELMCPQIRGYLSKVYGWHWKEG